MVLEPQRRRGFLVVAALHAPRDRRPPALLLVDNGLLAFRRGPAGRQRCSAAKLGMDLHVFYARDRFLRVTLKA
jgi:hypothetical protein